MDGDVKKYQEDIRKLLSLHQVNGADFWATPEGGVAHGGAFSTLEASSLLVNLGYAPTSPEMVGAANAIFSNLKEDGRIRTFATGTIYPCQTASAARTLCKLGYSTDPRLFKTYHYLLESQHSDGGWRCNASKYGKGPETAFSNPGPTLTVLDVFRHTGYLNNEKKLDAAVDFLLDHWTTRKPLGPCHYGIGSQFMKIEVPVHRYNILNYVYVLSFYNRARKDERFLEALDSIKAKLSNDRLVVEYANRKLKDLESCKSGAENDIATRYYNGIIGNLAGS
jgi:hypothetical protein